MDIETYEIESSIERSHWWFVGRRHLLRKYLVPLPRDTAIVDIGSSSGTNLRLLKEMGFSNYKGLDVSPESAYWCSSKSLGTVTVGSVTDMPFDDASFEYVLATDVLEHVADDGLAISEIVRILKPGGTLLATVPAHMILWGPQDLVSHHLRRYGKRGFNILVNKGGFDIKESYYFNFFLYLPILLARKLLMLLCRSKPLNENRLNAPFINDILKHIFKFDVAVASVLRVPFGVSIFVKAKKCK